MNTVMFNSITSLRWLTKGSSRCLLLSNLTTSVF